MDYMPKSEAELVIWFNDHAAGVATHGATVGLTSAEIAQAAIDALVVAHAVNGRALYESKAQEFTEYKNILLYAPLNTPLPATPTPPAIGSLPPGALAGCVTRARQRAERIKAHPNYTQAIGEDCRIVAPEASPPPDQPTLKAKVLTDYQVRLTFAMYRHDLLEIVSRRGNETDWTLLAFDTNSPYVDARPPLVPGQPETREYRARYRDNDQPVGDWSDIISVVAKP